MAQSGKRETSGFKELTQQVRDYCQKSGIVLRGYDEVICFVEELEKPKQIT